MPRFLGLLLVWFSLAITPVSAQDFQVLERVSAASVRVWAGDGGLGSGSVYYKNDERVLIITNGHVVGRQNAKVNLEFWYQGRLSRKIPGRIVFFVLNPRANFDCAAVEVLKKDLGTYFDVLEPIPLAPEDFVPDFSKIVSAGCPQGTWQTHWVGHGVGDLGGDKAVQFVPMPANGRSGSAIYQVTDEGIFQTGVITYRTKNPGKDGMSETDGEGIALLISHLRNSYKFQSDGSEASFVDYDQYEPIPVLFGQDPCVDEVVISSNLPGVELHSLRYVDPNAKSAPSEIPVDMGMGVAGESVPSDFNIFPSLPRRLQDCPDGTCPIPPQANPNPDAPGTDPFGPPPGTPPDAPQQPAPEAPDANPQDGPFDLFPSLPGRPDRPPVLPLPRPEVPKVLPDDGLLNGLVDRIVERLGSLLEGLRSTLSGLRGEINQDMEALRLKEAENEAGLAANILSVLGSRFDDAKTTEAGLFANMLSRMELNRQKLEEQIQLLKIKNIEDEKVLAELAEKAGKRAKDEVVGWFWNTRLGGAINRTWDFASRMFWWLVVIGVWWAPIYFLNQKPLWPLPYLKAFVQTIVKLFGLAKSGIESLRKPNEDKETIAALKAELEAIRKAPKA